MLPPRRRRKKEVEDPEDPWNAQLARALMLNHDLVEAERLIDCGADINAPLFFPDIYPYATLPLFIAMLLRGDVSASGVQAMQFLVDRGCTARRRIRLPSGDRGTILHALVELNDVSRLLAVTTLTGFVDTKTKIGGTAPVQKVNDKGGKEEERQIRVVNTRAQQAQQNPQRELGADTQGDGTVIDGKPMGATEGGEIADETTSQNHSKASHMSKRRDAAQKRSQRGNKGRKGKSGAEGRYSGGDGESESQEDDDADGNGGEGFKNSNKKDAEEGNGDEETHKEGVTMVAVHTANGEVHTSVLESYTLQTQPLEGAAGGGGGNSSAAASAGGSGIGTAVSADGQQQQQQTSSPLASDSKGGGATDANGKGKHAGKPTGANTAAGTATQQQQTTTGDAEHGQQDSKGAIGSSPSPAADAADVGEDASPLPQRLRLTPPSLAGSSTHNGENETGKSNEVNGDTKLDAQVVSSGEVAVLLSLVNYDAKTRKGKHTAVELALATHRPTLVGPLLANGATHDFTTLVNGRHTALARACILGDAAMVRTLLAAGDDPRQLASDGGWYSLVHYAVAQPQVISVLKNEFHIPLDSPNAFGDTPLISLIKYGAGRNSAKYVREAPCSKDAAELPGMQVSAVNNYILVTGSALPSVSTLPTSVSAQPRHSQYQHQQQQQQQQDSSPSAPSPTAIRSASAHANGEVGNSQQSDTMNADSKDPNRVKSLGNPSTASHGGIPEAPSLPSELYSQLSPAMAASLRYVAEATSSSSSSPTDIPKLNPTSSPAVVVGDGTILDRDIVGPWMTSSSVPLHFLHEGAEPNFWYFSNASTWEMIRTLVDCGVDVNSPGNRHAHNNAHAAASSAVLVDLTAMKWLSSTAAAAASTSNSARAASLSVAANRVSSRSSALLPAKFFHGMTPLMHTIHAYQPQLIRKLMLDFGADVNRRDAFGATALHYAATCCNVSALQFLLAVHMYKLMNPVAPTAAAAPGAGGGGGGAAPGTAAGGASAGGNAGTSSSQAGLSAASGGANANQSGAGAAAGAVLAPNALDRVVPFDINTQDDRGMTPLHCAVAKGNIGTVCLLLLAPGILPGLLNAQKQTPLHLAVLANELEIVELLGRRCAGEAEFLSWMQTVATAVEKVTAPDPTITTPPANTTATTTAVQGDKGSPATTTTSGGGAIADASTSEMRKSSASASWTLDASPFAVLLRHATRTAIASGTANTGVANTANSSNGAFITPSAILAAAKSKLDWIAKETASSNSGRGKRNSGTSAGMRDSSGNRASNNNNNNSTTTSSGRWHNLNASSSTSPQRSVGSMRGGGRRNSAGSGDDDVAAANNVLMSSSERMDGGSLDVDDTDASGRTALEMAVCRTQSMSVVEILVNIAGAVVNIPFSGYNSSETESDTMGDPGATTTVKKSKNKADMSGFTLLHKVVYDGNAAMVEFLLRSGADVSERDASDRTPLMVAFELQYTKIAELCLAYGSAVNDQSGVTLETSAHIACRHGNAALLQLLLHPPTTRSDALTEYGKKNRTQAIYVPRKKKRNNSGNGMGYRGFGLGSYGGGGGDGSEEDSSDDDSYDDDDDDDMYMEDDSDDENSEWSDGSSGRGSNSITSERRNNADDDDDDDSRDDYNDGETDGDERIASGNSSEDGNGGNDRERSRSPANYRRRTKVNGGHHSSAGGAGGHNTGSNRTRTGDLSLSFPWTSDVFTTNGVRNTFASYKRSALFSTTDGSHRTPIHLLCTHNDAAVQNSVTELLREMIWLEGRRAATSSSITPAGGPSVLSVRDRCGRTALHESCLSGFTQATRLLLSALHPERLFHSIHQYPRSDKPSSAAAAAASQSVPPVSEVDIQACEGQCAVPLTVLFNRDSNGWTALHDAVAAGDTKAVDILLAAVVNMLNTRGLLTFSKSTAAALLLSPAASASSAQLKGEPHIKQEEKAPNDPSGNEKVSRFLAHRAAPFIGKVSTQSSKEGMSRPGSGVHEYASERDSFAFAIQNLSLSHADMSAAYDGNASSGVAIQEASCKAVLDEVMSLLLQCDKLGRTPLLLAGELGKPNSAVVILAAIRAIKTCERMIALGRR